MRSLSSFSQAVVNMFLKFFRSVVSSQKTLFGLTLFLIYIKDLPRDIIRPLVNIRAGDSNVQKIAADVYPD